MNKYDKRLLKDKATRFANKLFLAVIGFLMLFIIFALFTGDVAFVMDCEDKECTMRYSNDHRP